VHFWYGGGEGVILCLYIEDIFIFGTSIRGENGNSNFQIPGIIFEVLPKFRSKRKQNR
jgi:hypothetical protein